MGLRRWRAGFDPEVVEAQMVAAHAIPPRGDPPQGPLGDLEALFTEFDERCYAHWRISMARQIQPALLRRLPPNDLLVLAGQTPEGYPPWTGPGISLERNKVDQNAVRARVELERRARVAGWWRSLLLTVVGALVGAGLTLLVTE